MNIETLQFLVALRVPWIFRSGDLNVIEVIPAGIDSRYIYYYEPVHHELFDDHRTFLKNFRCPFYETELCHKPLFKLMNS